MRSAKAAIRRRVSPDRISRRRSRGVMGSELGTTNLLLGIMAAVSVLEALVIIGVGVAGFMAYKRVMALVDTAMTLAQGIEARQVAPAMMRVNAILDDVKGVTAKVKEETERVD